MTSKTTNRFSPEVHARPVRVVLNHEHSSRDGNVMADRYGAIAAARARSAVQLQRGTPPAPRPRCHAPIASPPVPPPPPPPRGVPWRTAESPDPPRAND
jgi:hypothetical protein